MKKVVVFANQKGGVGKTTCTVNIGFELASRKKKILLIDMDPQGNLTSWCGIDPDSRERTIYDVLKGSARVEEVIVNVNKYLWVLPSNILASSVEREIFTQIGYEKALKKAISPVLDKFDHILIDCPPSLGALTINAMVACDEIFITVACEHLSVIGTNKLLETIEAIKENYNTDLIIGRVIPTMYSNTILATEMVKQLTSFFGDKMSKTKIRRNVKIGESSAMGQSIFQYDAGSIGARDFAKLVGELI